MNLTERAKEILELEKNATSAPPFGIFQDGDKGPGWGIVGKDFSAFHNCLTKSDALAFSESRNSIRPLLEKFLESVAMLEDLAQANRMSETEGTLLRRYERQREAASKFMESLEG